MLFRSVYKDCIGQSYNDYVETRQRNLFEYLEEYMGQTYSDKQQKTAEEITAQKGYVHKDMPDGIKRELPVAQYRG